MCRICCSCSSNGKECKSRINSIDSQWWSFDSCHLYRGLSTLVRANVLIVSDILGLNELFLKTEATAGLVFATTGVAVVVGIIALVGRICNITQKPTTSLCWWVWCNTVASYI